MSARSTKPSPELCACTRRWRVGSAVPRRATRAAARLATRGGRAPLGAACGAAWAHLFRVDCHLFVVARARACLGEGRGGGEREGRLLGGGGDSRMTHFLCGSTERPHRLALVSEILTPSEAAEGRVASVACAMRIGERHWHQQRKKHVPDGLRSRKQAQPSRRNPSAHPSARACSAQSMSTCASVAHRRHVRSIDRCRAHGTRECGPRTCRAMEEDWFGRGGPLPSLCLHPMLASGRRRTSAPQSLPWRPVGPSAPERTACARWVCRHPSTPSHAQRADAEHASIARDALRASSGCIQPGLLSRVAGNHPAPSDAGE